VLNYLLPGKLFMAFASMVTFSVVWVWLMILLSQVAMRRSLSGPEAAALHFPVPFWPYGQVFAIAFMLFIFIVLGVFPDTRLALFVGMGWLALLSVAYWLWARPARSGRQPPSLEHP